jgi:hypothetical protein
MTRVFALIQERSADGRSFLFPTSPHATPNSLRIADPHGGTCCASKGSVQGRGLVGANSQLRACAVAGALWMYCCRIQEILSVRGTAIMASATRAAARGAERIEDRNPAPDHFPGAVAGFLLLTPSHRAAGSRAVHNDGRPFVTVGPGPIYRGRASSCRPAASSGCSCSFLQPIRSLRPLSVCPSRRRHREQTPYRLPPRLRDS